MVSLPVPWLGHLVRTSGALKPGVPALGATCCFLFKKRSTSLSTLENSNDMTFGAYEGCVPRQADVTDAVSHVTAAGESLTDSGGVRFLSTQSQSYRGVFLPLTIQRRSHRD